MKSQGGHIHLAVIILPLSNASQLLLQVCVCVRAGTTRMHTHIDTHTLSSSLSSFFSLSVATTLSSTSAGGSCHSSRTVVSAHVRVHVCVDFAGKKRTKRVYFHLLG